MLDLLLQDAFKFEFLRFDYVSRKNRDPNAGGSYTTFSAEIAQQHASSVAIDELPLAGNQARLVLSIDQALFEVLSGPVRIPD